MYFLFYVSTVKQKYTKYATIAIFVSIFGFLDNFGLEVEKLFIEIQGIAKYDTSLAITFSLCAVIF